MNVEDIMLSEISQSQRDKYCVIPLLRHLVWSGSQRQKVEGWLPGAGAGEERELFNGYRVLLPQDEKSSGGWLHNSVNVFNTTEQNVKMVKMINLMCILPQ